MLGRLGFEGSVLVAFLGGLTGGARAQYLVNTCPALSLCEGGMRCAAGQHAALIPTATGSTICVCAPGTDASVGAPAMCCSDGSTCPGGGTCVDVDGADPSLCLTDEMRCMEAPVPHELAFACFSPPGTGTPQPYWQLGDCDGDGRANGTEIDTDPCCDEDTDLACCVATAPEPLRCCERVARDPVQCCLDESLGDAASCCALDDTSPYDCCILHDASSETCCTLYGAGEPGCMPMLDGGSDEDAGAADVGATSDVPDEDAGADDGGANSDVGGIDAGAGSDAGDLGFGGGGGCRCAAGAPRAPGAWALLGLLAIAIPTFRRRR